MVRSPTPSIRASPWSSSTRRRFPLRSRTWIFRLALLEPDGGSGLRLPQGPGPAGARRSGERRHERRMDQREGQVGLVGAYVGGEALQVAVAIGLGHLEYGIGERGPGGP